MMEYYEPQQTDIRTVKNRISSPEARRHNSRLAKFPKIGGKTINKTFCLFSIYNFDILGSRRHYAMVAGPKDTTRMHDPLVTRKTQTSHRTAGCLLIR
jgi:hypothetical protein